MLGCFSSFSVDGCGTTRKNGSLNAFYFEENEFIVTVENCKAKED
jgi:hypothetical protein